MQSLCYAIAFIPCRRWVPQCPLPPQVGVQLNDGNDGLILSLKQINLITITQITVENKLMH